MADYEKMLVSGDLLRYFPDTKDYPSWRQAMLERYGTSCEREIDKVWADLHRDADVEPVEVESTPPSFQEVPESQSEQETAHIPPPYATSSNKAAPPCGCSVFTLVLAFVLAFINRDWALALLAVGSGLSVVMVVVGILLAIVFVFCAVSANYLFERAEGFLAKSSLLGLGFCMPLIVSLPVVLGFSAFSVGVARYSIVRWADFPVLTLFVALSSVLALAQCIFIDRSRQTYNSHSYVSWAAIIAYLIAITSFVLFIFKPAPLIDWFQWVPMAKHAKQYKSDRSMLLYGQKAFPMAEELREEWKAKAEDYEQKLAQFKDEPVVIMQLTAKYAKEVETSLADMLDMWRGLSPPDNFKEYHQLMDDYYSIQLANMEALTDAIENERDVDVREISSRIEATEAAHVLKIEDALIRTGLDIVPMGKEARALYGRRASKVNSPEK